MKKRILIFVGSIVILLVGAITYVKLNPPLDILGVSANAEQARNSFHSEGDSFVIVANPENNGIGDIRLKQVLLNSGEVPKQTELGVGRSHHMVMVTHALKNVDKDEYISFHEIGDYPISPLTAIEEEGADTEAIKQYGIAVSHDEEIKNLIIKYSYFGIPFEKEVDLRDE